jgi:hypothetical protein
MYVYLRRLNHVWTGNNDSLTLSRRESIALTSLNLLLNFAAYCNKLSSCSAKKLLNMFILVSSEKFLARQPERVGMQYMLYMCGGDVYIYVLLAFPHA